MFKKVSVLLLVLLAVLMAVGPAMAQEVDSKVGIVLPTRDEPRWVQDETRFQEALAAAGYGA